MVRAKLKNIILNDIVAYFPYSIPEAERPDITAFKVYGDVKYTWLIFLVNDIHDPIFEWPLNSREFGTYIKDKYGSLTAARNVIHHYEQIVRNRVEATSTTPAALEKTVEVDEASYDALAGNLRRIVYYYDWEENRNNDKRDIKLIDRQYVADILSEHSEKFD